MSYSPKNYITLKFMPTETYSIFMLPSNAVFSTQTRPLLAHRPVLTDLPSQTVVLTDYRQACSLVPGQPVRGQDSL